MLIPLVICGMKVPERTASNDYRLAVCLCLILKRAKKWKIYIFRISVLGDRVLLVYFHVEGRKKKWKMMLFFYKIIAQRYFQ